MADQVVEKTTETTETESEAPRETVVIERDTSDRPAREGLSTGAIIAIVIVGLILLFLLFGRGLFGGSDGTTTPTTNVQTTTGQ